jgi:hypothetical protein
MSTHRGRSPQNGAEVRFRLASSRPIAGVLAELRSRRQGHPNRFVIDCAGIAELSPSNLADLLLLREQGWDIVLANCGPELRRNSACRNLALLLDEMFAVHAGHSLAGPHSPFRRRIQASA